MYLKFRGRGWIIGAVAFASLLLAYLLTDAYFHDPHYYEQNGWPKLAALWFSAVIVWRMLHQNGEETLGVQQYTAANRPLLGQSDTLMSVPAKYWPALLFALGVVFYFT